MPAETTPGGHHRFRLEEVDTFAGAPSPKLAEGGKLISTGAAARLLGVSRPTVARACRERRLDPDETTPGGHYRFSEPRIRQLAPVAGDLLSTGRAARALGLTVDELVQAVHRGVVTPSAITPGGHRRFSVSQLSTGGIEISPAAAQGQADG